MQIKTSEGNYDVASKGLGNTALGLGIAGLAVSLLGGNGNILGGLNGNASNGSKYVTKDELDMSMKISEQNATIALLQSEKTTDAKMVDVFKASAQMDRDLRDLIALNKAEQAQVNATQMAYNATANSSISVLQSQVAGLQAVTKMYIPSSNVCQSQCGCGCMANN